METTGTAAQLVERHGNRSVVLFAVEPQTNVVPQATIGYHFPLHCGSKGHVLLAHASPKFLTEYLETPLERLTQHTLTDADMLASRLEEVRDQGFAVTERDIRLTTGSVAAPVRDGSGAVTAAVTLITSATRLQEQRDQLVEMIVDIAATVSGPNVGRLPRTLEAQ